VAGEVERSLLNGPCLGNVVQAVVTHGLVFGSGAFQPSQPSNFDRCRKPFPIFNSPERGLPAGFRFVVPGLPAIENQFGLCG